MHGNPDSVSTKRRRIAELARPGRRVRAHRACECVIRGTLCSNASTYGSVGASGGQPPEATRPVVASSRSASYRAVPHSGQRSGLARRS